MSKRSRRNPTPKARQPRKWEKAFLESLRLTGNVTVAARAAKIDRSVVYEVRNQDEAFARAWDQAADEATDLLLEEARRRAADGVDEPVIYQGQLCGAWVNKQGEQVPEGTRGARFVPLTVNKRSDALIMFLIRGKRPEYSGPSKHQHEHSGPGGGPIPIKAAVDINAHLEEYASVFDEAAFGAEPAGGEVAGDPESLPADRAGESLDPVDADQAAGEVPG